jgi:trehalose synthase
MPMMWSAASGTIGRRTTAAGYRRPMQATSTALTVVPVSQRGPERFRDVVGDRYAEVETAIEHAKVLFEGRVIWHVNSTSAGGGVAELLHVLLPYARGAGVDVRWMVASGPPEFFRVTKTLHNALHVSAGGPLKLEEQERSLYRAVCDEHATALAALVRPGDVVYLHDPQTAGMVRRIKQAGATVVWRCHIGVDNPGLAARSAQEFLRPMIEAADSYIFSRPAYAWEGLDPDRVAIIAPSIDAFSPKNQEMGADVIDAILDRIGLTPDSGRPASFVRQDGTTGRVDRSALIVGDGPLPHEAPVVAQISRWDRLKDPLGVLEGFAGCEHAETAHLLLVGPDAGSIADDPEGSEVYALVEAAHRRLPFGIRPHVHLVSLPMEDIEENAAMVNAIQRRATVIVQKSLAEGFGLTATEAMWKGKPLVASAIGGLQDQVDDGVTGLLIADPVDLGAFAGAIDELLDDPERAGRMGEAAHERVRQHYLSTRHLLEYVELLTRLLA